MTPSYLKAPVMPAAAPVVAPPVRVTDHPAGSRPRAIPIAAAMAFVQALACGGGGVAAIVVAVVRGSALASLVDPANGVSESLAAAVLIGVGAGGVLMAALLALGAAMVLGRRRAWRTVLLVVMIVTAVIPDALLVIVALAKGTLSVMTLIVLVVLAANVAGIVFLMRRESSVWLGDPVVQRPKHG